MNRVIKFRLWNSAGEKSKMFYDTEQVMECLKQQALFNDKEHKYYKLGYDHEGDGSAFMQFTGLTDKNGKEIYEGDILKNIYTDSVFPVFYSASRPMFVAEVGMLYLDESYWYKCEVIGNIYQNPELLSK